MTMTIDHLIGEHLDGQLLNRGRSSALSEPSSKLNTLWTTIIIILIIILS